MFYIYSAWLVSHPANTSKLTFEQVSLILLRLRYATRLRLSIHGMFLFYQNYQFKVEIEASDIECK